MEVEFVSSYSKKIGFEVVYYDDSTMWFQSVSFFSI